MNLYSTGMGKLYPYLKVGLIIFLFTVTRISDSYAQVDVTIDVLLGLTNGNEDIVISPNPFYNELKVTHSESIQIYRIKIVDSNGQELYDLEADSPSTFQVLLDPAMYFIIMETNTGIVVEQVVLEEI